MLRNDKARACILLSGTGGWQDLVITGRCRDKGRPDAICRRPAAIWTGGGHRDHAVVREGLLKQTSILAKSKFGYQVKYLALKGLYN